MANNRAHVNFVDPYSAANVTVAPNYTLTRGYPMQFPATNESAVSFPGGANQFFDFQRYSTSVWPGLPQNQYAHLNAAPQSPQLLSPGEVEDQLHVSSSPHAAESPTGSGSVGSSALSARSSPVSTEPNHYSHHLLQEQLSPNETKPVVCETAEAIQIRNVQSLASVDDIRNNEVPNAVPLDIVKPHVNLPVESSLGSNWSYYAQPPLGYGAVAQPPTPEADVTKAPVQCEKAPPAAGSPNPLLSEEIHIKATNRKRKDPNHIPRPMNPFMIWSQRRRAEIAKEHPGIHNAHISTMLGKEWKEMSKEDKIPYQQKADQLKAQHKEKYPFYNYRPVRKPKKAAVVTSASGSPRMTGVNEDQQQQQSAFPITPTQQDYSWMSANSQPNASSSSAMNQMAASFNLFSYAQAQAAAALAYQSSLSAAFDDQSLLNAASAGGLSQFPYNALTAQYASTQQVAPTTNTNDGAQAVKLESQMTARMPYLPQAYQAYASIADPSYTNSALIGENQQQNDESSSYAAYNTQRSPALLD